MKPYFSSLRRLLTSESFTQTCLFVYALTGAFFLTFALKLFTLWTGDAPTWLLLYPGLLGGCLLVGLLKRFAASFVGARFCAWLAFTVALLACFAFGNTWELVEKWYTVCQQQTLSYEAWSSFIYRQLGLWCLPGLLAFPLLWQRNEQPRGRLIFFCGICVGVVLARIFVGAVPTTLLLDLCLGGMLLLALLWILSLSRTLTGYLLALCLLLLFAFAYYMGTLRTSQDLIRDVHPFAPIAMPDSLFRGTNSTTASNGVTFIDGRIVRVAGMDEASLVASQAIALLLKPNPDARIVARPIIGSPAFSTFETDELKGKCDALWIELPPAWLATEQGYFSTGAMATAMEHLFENGILIYDMDARPLDEEMLRRRAAILRTKFPHVQLWMTGLNRWQLVASRQPILTSLAAIDTLCDRETVMAPLFVANIDTPMTLLACCLVADTATLEHNRDAVDVDLRFRERTYARKNLFTRGGGRALAEAILPYYTNGMPWIQTQDDAETELLLFLADAAKVKLAGLAKANQETLQHYIDAGEVIENDPEFLDKATRDYKTAQDLEKLGKYAEALELYATAMTYAQPDLAQALHAADLAQKCRKFDLAEQFYRVAADIDDSNTNYLKCHINFLRETGQYKQAEKECLQLLRLLAGEAPEEVRLARFWLGVCIVMQPERETEGIRVLRRLVAQLQTPEEKAAYIPAYGQLLIDMGHFVEGRNIRRHFEETGTLLPASDLEKK